MIIKINRLVDIMNNTYVSNRDEKRLPNDWLSWSLSYTRTFRHHGFFWKWKDEAQNNDESFITWQYHEDLSWLIYSTIGIARTYLKEDKSRRMCQRKSDTDDCEHEFASSRLKNPKPTQGDMRKIFARWAGTRSSSAYTNF